MDKRSYNKRQVGTEKENLAAEYLKKKGYFIIEKNYRVRQGEIDLIARDGMCIVFVEVKYRANGRSGDALEAVTGAKIRQISKTALLPESEEDKHRQYPNPLRCDRYQRGCGHAYRECV
ncbi:MAG: YraN family protein [Coprococcus sp.]